MVAILVPLRSWSTRISPSRYDQTHSNRFFTFRDFYEEGEEPDFTNLKDGAVRVCSKAACSQAVCFLPCRHWISQSFVVMA